MPVEAPFLQAYLPHHCPDAAAVPAALAEGASSHGKNPLVVLRFMFRRVSHDVRVRSYSYRVKYEKWISRVSRNSTERLLYTAARFIKEPGHGASPRKRLTIAEKASRWAIVGQCRCPHDSRSALVDRTRSTSAAHIGCDPSWAHSVYKNLGGTKFACKCACQRIQGGLTDLIGGRPGAHIRERSRL